MARTYKRDSNGRFAGGGGGSSGGGSKRPAAKTVSRGVNRLTRDNAGKITSVGGEGATARGGRLRTAAGNKRATVTAKVAGGSPAGTMKGKVKRDTVAAGKVGQGKASVATAAKKRIAVPSYKTNTDLGRRGVVSMSARAKAFRSQNVKSLATEKGKEVLERIQGAGFRRGSRETKYNAPGSVGAKRIAKTAATQSRARAFAQQQVYSKEGGAYRGQRPEFNWKRSRATAKPAAAPKPAARRKPLTGVNDAVKGNLKGFKGLPVSLRSRSQAAAAQRQRNRKTIKSTEGQVIGARRGVTQTAGGGQKIRISKGKSEQMNLLTGRTDTVTNLKVKAVPTNKGSAPGSKSRRRSFGTMTRKMETPASALGRRRLRVGGIEAARKKATPYNTKKAAKTKATRGKALKFYESQKQGRR